ncbi:MAG: 2-C-methyl-D-erythritol 2,4-cyclodiphosphate synthase [Candidatus Melainabacteria bacterium]|jgi:2-C-methyl-D-erythritol 2,4-cyclodiphosphate synthase|nr:2-C-methyl-D-erythritol 2,4-cyclodiphosphate synthase [Candidatus Melainabacteria bacterium]
MRIGSGYDVHKLIPSEGKPLILGGVKINHEYKLLGHSDADVLVHAIVDALLGAMAVGDIGSHFPDNDPANAAISSMVFLEHCKKLLVGNNYSISNIDSTIIAQAPKLRPYIDQMRANIAEVLSLNISQVSVKATTTEGLGFTGRGEGIAAEAVVLLRHCE